jgi:cysteine-rich repeat protein
MSKTNWLNRIPGIIIACFFIAYPFVSVYAAYCGDGILDPQEECDDGNHIDRDGCSAYCKIEDMTPPSVVSASIPDKATGIPTTTNSITVVFSEEMKPASITKTTVRLEYNAQPIDLSYSLAADNKTLTITINKELFSSAAHSLRIKGVSDTAGNLMTNEFISVFTTAEAIDHTAPTIVIDPPGGAYNFSQNVTLTPYIDTYTGSDDFIDKTAKIYYTLNDSNISDKSPVYSLPITIQNNSTIRYFGVDAVGNKTRIFTETYIFQCPDFPNAKTVVNKYPTCTVTECGYGFVLRANSCVASLSGTDPNDYKANAVTAPLLPSATPMTITTKPAIFITPEHKGVIPRPLIFKDSVRGTVITFERDTKITDMDGKPFTGYIRTPENLYMKDFPINFGFTFKSIFKFFADDGKDLQFSPPIKITLPYTDAFASEEDSYVLTYDPKTEQYTEYSRGLYSTDLSAKTVTITSYKTGIFFVAQKGENFNQSIFSDVVTHWAKNYIEALYRKGIVTGRDAGIFAPNENLTRAEFVKVALKSIGENADDNNALKAPFTDVPLFAWYAPYISRAKDLGFISGRADGTFGPDDIINRAEAVKMLFTAFNFDLKKKPATPSEASKDRFIDLKETDWFYPYANFAIQNGIMEGVKSDSNDHQRYFYPSSSITRAEMAKLAMKTIELDAELKK